MYVLTYQMMIGILTRDARTAKDAVQAYDEIVAEGASMITIRRPDGQLVDITALRVTLTEPAPSSKPRGWGRIRFRARRRLIYVA